MIPGAISTKPVKRKLLPSKKHLTTFLNNNANEEGLSHAGRWLMLSRYIFYSIYIKLN